VRDSFSGKIAVVTGGANGIGRASALRLAQDGADVAVLDIEQGPLDKVAEAIRALGRKALPIALDLTSRDQVRDAFARISKELGWIEILHNNVGQTARERITEFWCSEPDVWDFVIGVSLMTTLMCSRLVVPEMRERRRGRIVNTASDSPLAGDPGVADYSAAKGGVMGFSRSLARELAPFEVTVNCVCPGPTRTRMVDRLPKEVLERANAAIPMGRMCEPEDIANAVAFLASDQARFITGQALVVNGGRVFY
jgi:NAD(P)-dependent dehydrogenase (short-subunit alcohol dehydrogenase family)